MGRAAKRKKQNVKQKQSASYEIQYQQQSSDYEVEQLQKIPTIAKLFDKIERLPQINCYLSPQALELFESFEQLTKRCLQSEVNEFARACLGSCTCRCARDIAKTLHIINALAVNDTVGAFISRESLENGIAIAYQNLTSGNWRVVANEIATESNRTGINHNAV
jgi:hypothetical protein